ncbi:hypothetical protein ACROYT_G013949 [Oculina patagonica]
MSIDQGTISYLKESPSPRLTSSSSDEEGSQEHLDEVVAAGGQIDPYIDNPLADSSAEDEDGTGSSENKDGFFGKQGWVKSINSRSSLRTRSSSVYLCANVCLALSCLIDKCELCHELTGLTKFPGFGSLTSRTSTDDLRDESIARFAKESSSFGGNVPENNALGFPTPPDHQTK